MDDPDTTLDIVRDCCPWMESVKLNFGRLLEEQFELFVLGVRSPGLLTRFGGVRDPEQATALKQRMTAAPLTIHADSYTAGTKLMTPQHHQERRRRSVGTELSTAATAATLDDKDKQILGVTKARRKSINAFPTLVPLTWAPVCEHPIVVPTTIIVPPAIAVTDTDTDARADTVTTTALDASHWHIPSGRNGFLSNSIKNLQLQIPGDSLYAVLLWLTRAGLDGRLQGLRSFRLSGQETSAVFGVPSSAIHDFLAAHSGLEQLTLLSIQVEPAPSENPWDCLEGSEGSETLQLMVDYGSSPTPTTATAPTSSDSGITTRGAGTESHTKPEGDEGGAAAMTAIAAALTAVVAGNTAQPALYKGIHYKTHIPNYFADLISTNQSTLEELKSADPGATRSRGYAIQGYGPPHFPRRTARTLTLTTAASPSSDDRVFRTQSNQPRSLAAHPNLLPVLGLVHIPRQAQLSFCGSVPSKQPPVARSVFQPLGVVYAGTGSSEGADSFKCQLEG